MIQEHHKYEHIEVSVFQEAKHGKTCCGDSYFVNETDDYFICAVADGLGSGEFAKESSEKATTIIEKFQREHTGNVMEKCNKALSRYRGAVLSVFKIHFQSRLLEYCGIGNVRCVFFPPEGKPVHPLPTSGFLSGLKADYRIQEFPFKEGSSFAVYSDGFEMSSEKRELLSRICSPTDLSNHITSLLETGMNDDVTFLMGKSLDV